MGALHVVIIACCSHWGASLHSTTCEWRRLLYNLSTTTQHAVAYRMSPSIIPHTQHCWTPPHGLVSPGALLSSLSAPSRHPPVGWSWCTLVLLTATHTITPRILSLSAAVPVPPPASHSFLSSVRWVGVGLSIFPAPPCLFASDQAVCFGTHNNTHHPATTSAEVDSLPTVTPFLFLLLCGIFASAVDVSAGLALDFRLQGTLVKTLPTSPQLRMAL